MRSPASRNADRWGARAAIRAEHYATMTRPAWAAVAEATGLGAGLRVLDIACGSGEFCRLAADRGATVSGVDAAEGMIEIARRVVPEADIRLGPMERLPWPDETFDLVTGFNAFQLAEDMVDALAEARRVTRADGRVAICNWGPRDDRELRVITEALRAVQPPDTPLPTPRGMGEPGVLEDLARRAGLDPRPVHTLDVPYVAPDEDTMVRAMLTAPSALAAIDHVGEDRVRTVIIDAAARFRRDDGSFRFENTYIYVITTRGAHA